MVSLGFTVEHTTDATFANRPVIQISLPQYFLPAISISESLIDDGNALDWLC
jgi:hypothetical protein